MDEFSIEAALKILELAFPQPVVDRMRELAAKARDGALSEEERKEISNLEMAGNLLAVLKSKARQRLKKDLRSDANQ